MVANGGRRASEARGCQAAARSSDSSSERPPSCSHVTKAVDSNKVRKALKKAGGLAEDCSKCPPRDPDADYVLDDSLWICLLCGTQLCGRQRNRHAIEHYETPHTGLHALAAEPRTLVVYCYSCNAEIDCGSHRKLKDALDLFRNFDKRRSSPESEPDARRSSVKTAPSYANDAAAAAAPPIEAGPPVRRVRGLTNLGNTCFFNSVLQCLVQTPYLVEVLREMANPGQKFRLPGGSMKFKPPEKKRPKNDDEEPNGEREAESEREAERDVELSPICGELAEWGDFTETLTETVQELQKPGKYDVFSPIRLFRKLETKIPQFAGGDQHDSHELLRHLLEAVRSEDLKRYKVVILQKLGLDTKEKRSEIDEETKQKVKFYGNQASEAMLRPGQVFRGMLVSTLQCQDCNYSSHTTEHFLDLSLPITADKPVPPDARRSVRRVRYGQQDKVALAARNAPGNAPLGLNSDAPEKEKAKNNTGKRKVRKNWKGGGHNHASESNDSNQNGDVINENKVDNKSSSEQSDADVEDNVEENSTRRRRELEHRDDSSYSQQGDGASKFSAFYSESGYNSEKMISSDSIRSSPVDATNAEKSDASPERPDKDVEDGEPNLPSSVIALPYKSLAVDDSPQLSNPDSGVASPETAKRALFDAANVESPITSKELGSPTSLSSEINMDISSPRQSNNSPVGAEMDRPVSRISFNDANNQKSNFENALPLNDVAYMNAENEPDSSEDKFNKMNYAFDKITFDNMNFDKKTASQENDYERNSSKFNNKTSPAFDNIAFDQQKQHNSSNGLTLYMNDNRENSSYSIGPQRLTSPEIDSPKWKSSNCINTVSPRVQCDEGEISIQSCLNQFTSSELLTGSNKVGCDACTKRANSGKTVYTNATKRFLISNPPGVLILHLKRFQLGPRCMLRKLTKAVTFPTVLDIAPFCSEKVKTLPNVSPNQSKILYSLYGIVEHSGGMHLGHYVAYVKVRSEIKANDPRWKFLPTTVEVDGQQVNLPDILNGLNNVNDNDTDSSLSGYESGEGAVGGSEVEPPDGKWYYVSDSRVQETTEEKVLNAQAYLLFYERIL